MAYCPDPVTALILAVHLQARSLDQYAETFYQQPAEYHLNLDHYHTTTSSGSANIYEPIMGNVSDEIREQIRTAYYTPWPFQA